MAFTGKLKNLGSVPWLVSFPVLGSNLNIFISVGMLKAPAGARPAGKNLCLVGSQIDQGMLCLSVRTQRLINAKPVLYH
jgi:hypothetical protein